MPNQLDDRTDIVLGDNSSKEQVFRIWGSARHENQEGDYEDDGAQRHTANAEALLTITPTPDLTK